jgi:peptide/nickel transport system substrate-binding protein
MKRKWMPLLVVVVLLVPLLSCGSGEAPPPPAAPTSAPGRVEVLRLDGQDSGLPTPFLWRKGGGLAYMFLIFDTLVWKDSTGGFIPWLATSWESSPDGLVWTFKLREDVEWHDGKPFTADDVVFTYQYVNRPGLTYTGRVEILPALKQMTLEAVDAHTVRITLGTPYAPFLRNVIGNVPIIPRHIWEGVEDPKQFTEDEALIGTGAYRLLAYDKAEGSYLFEANDGFWLGPPHVKRVEVVPVANPALALKQGEVHGAGEQGEIHGGGTGFVSQEVLATFRDDPRFDIIEAPGDWNLVLYFNMERGLPFSDTAFRQAVAHALDLQMMVDRVILGDGLPGLPGQLPVSNPWMNPEVPGFVHDPAAATALLEQAGYQDTDGDGVRETPEGNPLQLELTYNSAYQREAEMIQAWLKPIGIGIDFRGVDSATASDITAEGKYELAFVGFGGRGADPDTLRSLFSSQSTAGSFARVFGYKNERFDDLAAQQLGIVDDQARRALVDEMQVILAKDLPSIPLYYPNYRYVFDKTLLDAWYFTPGGFASGCPNSYNKQMFITGEQTGLTIRSQ